MWKDHTCPKGTISASIPSPRSRTLQVKERYFWKLSPCPDNPQNYNLESFTAPTDTSWQPASMGSLTFLIAPIRGKQRPSSAYHEVHLDDLGNVLRHASTSKLFLVPEGQTWGKAEKEKFSLPGKIMKLLRLGIESEYFMNKIENWAYLPRWFLPLQSQSLTSERRQFTVGTHPASWLAHLTHPTVCRSLPLHTHFNHLNLLSSWCLLV